MTIYETIITAYPELLKKPDSFTNGTIGLQDDSDGVGVYVVKWNYSKPIPDGLVLGKPAESAAL